MYNYYISYFDNYPLLMCPFRQQENWTCSWCAWWSNEMCKLLASSFRATKITVFLSAIKVEDTYTTRNTSTLAPCANTFVSKRVLLQFFWKQLAIKLLTVVHVLLNIYELDAKYPTNKNDITTLRFYSHRNKTAQKDNMHHNPVYSSTFSESL